MVRGEDLGVAPIGLAARDTLRFEVCYCLYGHELGEDLDFIARVADERFSAAGAGGPAASREKPARFWGFKHFGLYIYRREALLKFVEMAPSPLERVEKLEQLRFLENGMPIRVIETAHDSIGVDTPEDLESARRIMEGRAQ